MEKFLGEHDREINVNWDRKWSKFNTVYPKPAMQEIASNHYPCKF